MKKNEYPLESIEQINFCLWMDKNFPDIFYFAIPNGQLRNKTIAMKLKREGVKKGVPDIFLPEWNLFIEMKRKKGGVVSKEQKEVMEKLEKAGYKCLVARGFEQAKEIIFNRSNL